MKRGRRGDMIVSDIVFKIWVRRIKYRNYNATEKFYGRWWFQKIIRKAEVFPMESNTETVAKRPRLGPRTGIPSTMERCFRGDLIGKIVL